MIDRAIRLDVPDWIDVIVDREGSSLTSVEARMGLAIRLSHENLVRGGGPFGAIVCAGDRLVAAGVNLVLSSGFSLAHAEIVAFLRAQQALDGAKAESPLTLYTSSEPCCQCFGAFVWSGLDALVCGASRSDVEAIGFDEGPKPEDWQRVLREKGFEVAEGVLRSEARAVLEEYRRRGGTLYGLRSPRVRR